MNFEEARVVEEEAKRLTWHAWIDRDVGRLFPCPEIVAVRQRIVKPSWWGERNRRVWSYMDGLYRGKAVGVIPPLDNQHERGSEDSCVVGVWTGIGAGYFGGADLTMTSFTGPGSTRHRSPFNIGFVHVLPVRFQGIAERLWDDEGTERCSFCGYLFKDGELREEACRCHYLCAGCCTGERAREAIEERQSRSENVLA